VRSVANAGAAIPPRRCRGALEAQPLGPGADLRRSARQAARAAGRRAALARVALVSPHPRLPVYTLAASSVDAAATTTNSGADLGSCTLPYWTKPIGVTPRRPTLQPSLSRHRPAVRQARDRGHHTSVYCWVMRFTPLAEAAQPRGRLSAPLTSRRDLPSGSAGSGATSTPPSTSSARSSTSTSRRGETPLRPAVLSAGRQ